MESLNAIKSYYEYLTKTANLAISVHYLPGQHNKSYFINALPIPKLHFNPYCTFIKQTLQLHPKCLNCQERAISKCISEGAFTGICHAGVFEFVYPLKFGDNVAGMLSVSEYLSEKFMSCSKKIQETCNLSLEAITGYSTVLKTDIPTKEYVDTLIVPLLCMIKNMAVIHDGNRNIADSLFHIKKVVSFCDRFYTRKITLDTLSEKFFCSTSYIAHNFKKETGKSLPKYLNHLRIKHAMELLKSTNADIAQIGESVGYEDPSYFTKCFVKITGTTPKKWRQQNEL